MEILVGKVGRAHGVRGEVALGMLRLPTLESGGRANLHQGGVGVGVDVHSGRTTRAVWCSHEIWRP